jgi:uncharacterized protein
MERLPNFPNVWTAVLVLVVFYGLQLLMGVLVVGIAGAEVLKDPHVAVLVAAGALAATIAWLVRLKALDLRSLMHDSRSSVQAVIAVLVAPTLLASCGAAILLTTLEVWLMRWFPPPQAEYELFLALARGGGLTMVLLCLVAPVLEEMLFRGIVLRSFLKQYPPLTAMVLSALIFAIAHFRIYQSVAALVVGLMLAWLYVRTRSLWAPIMAHGFYNASALAFSWLGEDPVRFADPREIEVPGLRLQLLGIVLLTAGATALRKLLQASRQS